MTEHVAGKVIIITGAASGFGRLLSSKAAARGARLALGDIDGSALAATVAELEAGGSEVVSAVTDVRRLPDLQGLVARALTRFGAVDVMVNNAGTMPLAFFADHARAMEAWERCIDVNFKGVLHGIAAVHDQMIAQGRGHVINLSSIYSNFPVAGAGVYVGTKMAVNALSESLRVESQGRIKVTNVRPTGVPSTNLAAGIVNMEAVTGIYGQNAALMFQKMPAMQAGELPAEEADPEHIEYFALAPEYIADAILHAIDQPWGVSISDITVRASGDLYIL
ncbi:MAG: SDR family NAD(P)-dependent oxidoreductase [Pseudomonadales bacterium]